MRRQAWLIAGLVTAGLLANGCTSTSTNPFYWNPFYKCPDVQPKFAKIVTGMDKDEVIKIMGRPTSTVGHEMWYIYDDPSPNVSFRMRFVLDDSGAVTEKYYETKAFLQERLKQQAEGRPVPELVPGEEPRKYPGGPMQQFQDLNK